MRVTKFPVWKTSQNRKRSDAGYESNRNESIAGRQRRMAGGYTRNHTKTLLLLWNTQFKGLLLECDSIQSRRRLCVPQSSPVGGAVLCDSRQRCYYGYGKNIQQHIQKGNLFLVERGEIHRIFNDGDEPLQLLLICTGNTPLPEG